MSNDPKATPNAPESPEAYIRRQPADRQEALSQLRQVIRTHLPPGFQETMQYGMIAYVVPHALYPAGYHADPREPLPFMALANQKGYIALYHMGLYADDALLKWFTEGYGRLAMGRLDMGKSCIRFRKTADIPYELVGALCGKRAAEAYIALYESRKPRR